MTVKKEDRQFGKLKINYGYGWTQLNPLQLPKVLNKAVKHFKVLNDSLKPDAIAYTGSSGAAIAFLLAIKYKIPIIYVRKPREQSHGMPVECNSHGTIASYVIVDDMVATGSTMKRIINRINYQAARTKVKAPVCVGVYCYANGTSGRYSREVEGQVVTISAPDDWR